MAENLRSILSGSLVFRDNETFLASIVPHPNALTVTGSLRVTGSNFLLNGSDIGLRLTTLEAGQGADQIQFGAIALWTASIGEWTGSTDAYIDNLNLESSSLKTFSGSIETRVDSLESTASVENVSSSLLNTRLDDLESKPLVSSSAQIDGLGFLSASIQGIVSRSAQISDLGYITGSKFYDLDDIPQGIVSSSTQLTALAPTIEGVVHTTGSENISGSLTITGPLTVNGGNISGSFVGTVTSNNISATGSFSGSFIGDGTQIDNVVHTSGEESIDGSLTLTGPLKVTGNTSTTGLTTLTGSLKAINGTISGSFEGNGLNITEVVHTSGNEEIAGIKQFTDGITLGDSASLSDTGYVVTVQDTDTGIYVQKSALNTNPVLSLEGPGRQLRITSNRTGSAEEIKFNYGGAIKYTQNDTLSLQTNGNNDRLTIDANGNTILYGDLSASNDITASAFKGDGSALENVNATVRVTGNTGTGSFTSLTQNLLISGGNNVSTTGSGQQIEINIDNSPTFTNLNTTNNVTVGGSLFVNGDLSYVNTTNLEVKDKFILLNSGSIGVVGGGIVVDQGGGSGSAIIYDSADGRWGMNNMISADSSSAASKAYLSMVVNESDSNHDINDAATAQVGNIRVNASGEIFIYA